MLPLTFQRIPQSSIIYDVWLSGDPEPLGKVWELPNSTQLIQRWCCSIDLGTTSHTSTTVMGYGLTKESAATSALRNALIGTTYMVERIEAICERCDIRRTT
jgi:hypothetical protein